MFEKDAEGGGLMARTSELTAVAQQLAALSRYCGEQSGAVPGVTPGLTQVMTGVEEAAGGYVVSVRPGAEAFAAAWAATFAVFEDSAAVMSGSAGGLAVDLDVLDRAAGEVFVL